MKNPRLTTNPIGFILALFGITFLVELFVHSTLLPQVGIPTTVGSALIDAFTLILFLSPAVFFLVYKPLASEISKRQKIEQQYQTLFENSPNSILAVIGQAGKIIRVNPQTEKTFGYASKELLGKEVEYLIPEHLTDKHREYRKGYMKAPTARPMGVGRDLRGLRKDGSEFPVEVALTPIKLDGQVIILTTITDITVRKSLEMQRDDAIEGGRVGIWDWDLKTGHLNWSERCRELFSLNSNQEPTYDLFLQAISPLDRARVDKAVKESLEEKKSYEVEMRVPLPDGTIRWILSKGRGHFDRKGKVIRMSGVAIDITEQKRATLLRDEVIAIVSHDLKNPLTSINLNTSVLEKMHPNDEHIQKRTQEIRRTTNQMSKLLNDLLDVARLESGHIELIQKEQLISPIAKEVLDMFSPLLKEKRLRVEMAQEFWGTKASFDHDRMIQVFSNILGNAIKFTPIGGCISLKYKSEEQGLTISISDTGPGISPEELPHVFDRFWQAKRTKKAGTGLGLSIVKGIIEAHGGKVWIESQYGKGTTVYFTVPTRLKKVA